VLLAVVNTIRRGSGSIGVNLAAFLVGAGVPGSMLVPTLFQYGLLAGGVDRAIEANAQSPAVFLTIVARFLSFVSFEINRFLGLTTADRVFFFWRQPWILPFVVVVIVAGVVQPIAMAAAWFMRRTRSPEWLRIRWLVGVTLVWVFASFFLSVRGPLAHAFYVLMPLAFVYACHCWPQFASPRLTRAAVLVLVCGVLVHAALAIDRRPRQSLYLDRPLVQAAISARNDRFLGDRRDSAHGMTDRNPRPVDPMADVDAYVQSDPVQDLEVTDTGWSRVLGGRFTRVSISIRNESRAAAYLDIRFVRQFLAQDDEVLAEREGVIKEILQPGTIREWRDLADVAAPPGTERVRIVIMAAEKCIPARGHGLSSDRVSV
jgi:hypothetical protein